MYYALRSLGWWWVRKERLAGWVGLDRSRAWCSGVPEAKRKGVRPRRMRSDRLFSFLFLGAWKHVWEDQDVLVISFAFSLLLLFRDRRLASFSSESPVDYLFSFCCFHLCHPSLTFSSFALVSISLSVNILRLIVTWTDLPFSFFFLSDQQPSTGAYPCGAKIRPSCSVDL